MNKLFILLFIFLNFAFCFSQTYLLNINLSDGTKIQYAINDIKKIDFSGITNIEDAKKIESVISSFKLLQNYPNPFNPSTTIEYEIPKSGKVEVSIYDLNGRLIKILVNANQNQGNHKVNWDGVNQSGKKVSSGFYVYSIKFENSVSSKKMILVK